MAIVTIADDAGHIERVIIVENVERGDFSLPQGARVFDGRQVDRGGQLNAAAALHQVQLTKDIFDALHEVRGAELDDHQAGVRDETCHDEGHCQKIGDHEQRLMHLEARLPKQGWRPPVKRNGVTRWPPYLWPVPNTPEQE